MADPPVEPVPQEDPPPLEPSTPTQPDRQLGGPPVSDQTNVCSACGGSGRRGPGPLREGRSPFDYCRCGHTREDHVAKVGCTGGYEGHCECSGMNAALRRASGERTTEPPTAAEVLDLDVAEVDHVSDRFDLVTVGGHTTIYGHSASFTFTAERGTYRVGDVVTVHLWPVPDEGRQTYGPMQYQHVPEGWLWRLWNVQADAPWWCKSASRSRVGAYAAVEALPPEDWQPEPAEGDEWVRATALTEWASTQREAADDYEAQGLAAEAAELRRQAAVADRCAASPTAGDPAPTVRRAAFHPSPIPHLVMSRSAWDGLPSEDRVEGSGVAGQFGTFIGTPVYLDTCPSLWPCAAPVPEPTPAPDDATVAALPEKWRAAAEGHWRGHHYEGALDACADELEAALRTEGES